MWIGTRDSQLALLTSRQHSAVIRANTIARPLLVTRVFSVAQCPERARTTARDRPYTGDLGASRAPSVRSWGRCEVRDRSGLRTLLTASCDRDHSGVVSGAGLGDGMGGAWGFSD